MNPKSLPTSSPCTAAALLAMPGDGNRYELVRGVLKMMSPAGSEHGWIAARIATRLSNHVEKHSLGRVYAAETGFQISADPDTVRAPDTCYVSNARLAAADSTAAYLRLAPDLVVEVVSPNDTSTEVESKATEWLDAGTQIVLIADPALQTIRVFRKDTRIQDLLGSGDVFDSGEVCDHWTLDLNDTFDIRK